MSSMARSIDGAEQMFTRARDFGYSKSAEETLRVWGREEVLGDLAAEYAERAAGALGTRLHRKIGQNDALIAIARAEPSACWALSVPPAWPTTA